MAGRLWNLCHVLRDDGVVYHKYLSELTYLLFLKNAKQLGVEDEIPLGSRWGDLLEARGPGMLGAYRKLLTRLGEDSGDSSIRNIFAFPTTVFSHDENLEKVVDGIQAIDWHDYRGDSLGLIYEKLLERNATEARSGSGQYFTPRALVDSMVSVMRPRANETVLDPAVGTGGFLIAAHRAIEDKGAGTGRFEGVEIERDTYRLGLMNLYLHQMDGEIVHGDALSEDSNLISLADVVLANPPFGVSSGGARPRRSDLPYPTSNKQLAFLQLIILSLAPGGRAAVVVPDNVLFEPGVGRSVRHDLVENLDLHTVLRLPRGIFYAPGVKTNVLFFSRPTEDGKRDKDGVWFYDLRSEMPAFTRRRSLRATDFADFESAYGDDPHGRSARTAASRFRLLSLSEVRDRDYDLDFRGEDLGPPDALPDLAELMERIDSSLAAARAALAEIDSTISGSELAEGADVD